MAEVVLAVALLATTVLTVMAIFTLGIRLSGQNRNSEVNKLAVGVEPAPLFRSESNQASSRSLHFCRLITVVTAFDSAKKSGVWARKVACEPRSRPGRLTTNWTN